MTLLDRLAIWWLRRRHGTFTVMSTPAEQHMLEHYDELAGTERS